MQSLISKRPRPPLPVGGARLVGFLAFLALPLSCQRDEGPSSSSSSHWIVCASDADCANLPWDATCSSEGETSGYCVDEEGVPLQLVEGFSSDFGEDGLDSSLFRFELGADIRNGELQTYTESAENVFVEGDELVITALYDQSASEYTSSSLEILQPVQYGRVEASILGDVGSGARPDFWMLPADPGSPETTCDGASCFESTWPVWGAVTIMSARADGSIIAGTSFATEVDGSLELLENLNSVDARFASDEFHEYALEWGPERMDFFVDDELVHTVDLTDPAIYRPGGEHPFHKPFSIKLNLAVGGLTEAPTSEDYPRQMRVRDLRVLAYRVGD